MHFYRMLLKAILLGSLLMSLAGCGTLGYLVQAGAGQLAIANRARPIEDVIADERVSPQIRNLLKEIPSIKAFGEQQGLKPTKNYTDYVQLDRPAAVWVVSAAEALKFKSKEWSFPIVGTVPYLGWFDLKRAQEFARELEREGWDVDLRGAGAYSTLGWFKDPILSSMIDRGNAALGGLVNVVLHESVHATFYIYGQAYFDESLAKFVGDRLTEQYLELKRGATAGETQAYQQAEKRGQVYDRRMHETYLQLDRLYNSARPDEEKRQKKAEILGALQQELQARRPFTNATLLDHKEYNTGLEEFANLFKACNSDWARFWRVIRTVEATSFSKTNEPELSPLLTALTKRCH